MDRGVLGATGIIGLLVGWTALQGGSVTLLIDVRAAALTLGGAVAATMLQHPISAMKVAIGRAWEAVRWRPTPSAPLIEQFRRYAERSRREGLLSLEDEVAAVEDPFLAKGLTLTVDGASPTHLRQLLELDVVALERRYEDAAATVARIGRSAQACGVIGTLFGFVQVLGSGKLGAAAAAPLVATLYGAGLDGLLLQPLAGRIRSMISHESWYRTAVLEGLIALVEGDAPKMVELKLRGLLGAPGPTTHRVADDGLEPAVDEVKRYA